MKKKKSMARSLTACVLRVAALYNPQAFGLTSSGERWRSSCGAGGSGRRDVANDESASSAAVLRRRRQHHVVDGPELAAPSAARALERQLQLSVLYN